jgi:hypothetical protein
METFYFIGNIVLIDVKDKGRRGDYRFQGKDCKMEIDGNIVFRFFMLDLDTLSLKPFLL